MCDRQIRAAGRVQSAVYSASQQTVLSTIFDWWPTSKRRRVEARVQQPTMFPQEICRAIDTVIGTVLASMDEHERTSH